MLEKRTAPITDRIVCVADEMSRQSLAAGIGTPQQYVTIYSGMETEPFLKPPVSRVDVRRQLGLEERHIAVGTIARLFHLKGHEDLLVMAPRLCARFADLRFLWIGDGLLRADFERQITGMGLKDRFILTGLVPPEQIPQLANAMDVLVHPSRREGLARALAQAALAGKPALTYDIDGNREGVLDGRTGFVVRAFDSAKLEEALVKLLVDPGLRERFGAAGREFALKRFDARVMVDALEELYRHGIDSRHRPASR
jgi:glycosyltransferase involved in cell wall biosynthesis